MEAQSMYKPIKQSLGTSIFFTKVQNCFVSGSVTVEFVFNFFYLKCYYCRIQPVYVVDVASALTTVLKDDGTSMGKTYELGGPDIFTVHDLVIISYFSSLLVILYFIFDLNMIFGNLLL